MIKVLKHSLTTFLLSSLAQPRFCDFGMTWAAPRLAEYTVLKCFCHFHIKISKPNISVNLVENTRTVNNHLQDEAQEGFDGSYRDFYLMENPTCTHNNVEAYMRSLTAREWEELNRECFCRRTFSSSFTRICLNAARMISVMYLYDKEKRLLVPEDYSRMLLL
jgi:(3S)-linalool synthase